MAQKEILFYIIVIVIILVKLLFWTVYLFIRNRRRKRQRQRNNQSREVDTCYEEVPAIPQPAYVHSGFNRETILHTALLETLPTYQPVDPMKEIPPPKYSDTYNIWQRCNAADGGGEVGGGEASGSSAAQPLDNSDSQTQTLIDTSVPSNEDPSSPSSDQPCCSMACSESAHHQPSSSSTPSQRSHNSHNNGHHELQPMSADSRSSHQHRCADNRTHRSAADRDFRQMAANFGLLDCAGHVDLLNDDELAGQDFQDTANLIDNTDDFVVNNDEEFDDLVCMTQIQRR